VVSKPRQDFQSGHVPAVNRQLKSAGLTELHLEGASRKLATQWQQRIGPLVSAP
jgi:formate hydrogenlyase subunit 4